MPATWNTSDTYRIDIAKPRDLAASWKNRRFICRIRVAWRLYKKVINGSIAICFPRTALKSFFVEMHIIFLSDIIFFP